MDGQKPLVEQTCHPPGEAHGVNITVSPDGSVGVQGSAYSHPLAGAHDMSLQKLLTGQPASRPLAKKADASEMSGASIWPICIQSL